MTSSSLWYLAILALFVPRSWQQRDPVQNFCRRFGHQSTVIDDKLYLDGGLVNWNPISTNPQNYSGGFTFPEKQGKRYQTRMSTYMVPLMLRYLAIVS